MSSNVLALASHSAAALQVIRRVREVVARAYVLYRERRAGERAAQAEAQGVSALHVTIDGERHPLDVAARTLISGRLRNRRRTRRQRPVSPTPPG